MHTFLTFHYTGITTIRIDPRFILAGVFNLVRGRRIFRKKSAHNKLYTFGAEMF